MAKRSTTNYVDNAKLLVEMIDYKKQYLAHKADPTLPKAVIPDYVATSIMKISERLSSRPNFSGYTYRDEMVSDGIENCLVYIANFDETKYKNPFAYFTTIIYYAFLRRITKEKKQSFIKMKLFESMDYKGEVIKKYLTPEEDKSYSSPYAEVFKLTEADLGFFEKKQAKKEKARASSVKKVKEVKGALDDFSEEDIPGIILQIIPEAVPEIIEKIKFDSES
jgi:hypothetical protein